MDIHVFLQDQLQTTTSTISHFQKEKFLASFDRKDACKLLPTEVSQLDKI